MKKTNFYLVDKSSFLFGGGCGIRTHVRLLSNGFQDRLVMTTSITLHKSDAYSAYIFLLSYFTTLMRACQEVFQKGVFFSWAKGKRAKNSEKRLCLSLFYVRIIARCYRWCCRYCCCFRCCFGCLQSQQRGWFRLLP